MNAKELELVVPTVEQMRCSIEGYSAGGMIPLPAKNMDRVKRTKKHIFIHSYSHSLCLDDVSKQTFLT